MRELSPFWRPELSSVIVNSEKPVKYFFLLLSISRDIFVINCLRDLENLRAVILLCLTCAEEEAKMAAIERCTL